MSVPNFCSRFVLAWRFLACPSDCFRLSWKSNSLGSFAGLICDCDNVTLSMFRLTKMSLFCPSNFLVLAFSGAMSAQPVDTQFQLRCRLSLVETQPLVQSQPHGEEAQLQSQPHGEEAHLDVRLPICEVNDLAACDDPPLGPEPDEVPDTSVGRDDTPLAPDPDEVPDATLASERFLLARQGLVAFQGPPLWFQVGPDSEDRLFLHGLCGGARPPIMYCEDCPRTFLICEPECTHSVCDVCFGSMHTLEKWLLLFNSSRPERASNGFKTQSPKRRLS